MQRGNFVEAYQSLRELIQEINRLNIFEVPQETQFNLVINLLSKNENLNVAFGAYPSQLIIPMNNQNTFTNIPFGTEMSQIELRNRIIQKFTNVSTYKILIMIEYNKMAQLRNVLRTIFINSPYTAAQGISIIIYNMTLIEKQNAQAHLTQLIQKFERDDNHVFQILNSIYDTAQCIFLTIEEMKNREFLYKELCQLLKSDKSLTCKQIKEIIPQSLNQTLVIRQEVIESRLQFILKQIFKDISQKLQQFQTEKIYEAVNLVQSIENLQNLVNNFKIGQDNYKVFIGQILNTQTMLEMQNEDELIDELNRILELMDQMNKLKMGKQFKMTKINIKLNVSNLNRLIRLFVQELTKQLCIIM